MKRTIVDQLTRAVGWLYRKKSVSLAGVTSPVKVNLGSSLVVAKGWINIDGSLSALCASWPPALLKIIYRLASMSAQYGEAEYIALLKGHRFIFYNLEYGIPLPSACADYVYSSHFLEHLSKRHGARLLAEAFRVLRPGGIIRIAVPDLQQMIDAYQAGQKEAALDGIFAYLDLGYFARHRYMYDYEILSAQLLACGFTDVRRCAFQVGEVPDIAILDNRPGSLVVEAAKPHL
ncbi:MAG TPA: methyltransferase domain-containing protein [Roseiflexaceae bacterium]|nr:methyltransferase domain-containing protein [Roseiflexaceae bacterium]